MQSRERGFRNKETLFAKTSLIIPQLNLYECRKWQDALARLRRASNKLGLPNYGANPRLGREYSTNLQKAVDRYKGNFRDSCTSQLDPEG